MSHSCQREREQICAPHTRPINFRSGITGEEQCVLRKHVAASCRRRRERGARTTKTHLGARRTNWSVNMAADDSTFDLSSAFVATCLPNTRARGQKRLCWPMLLFDKRLPCRLLFFILFLSVNVFPRTRTTIRSNGRRGPDEEISLSRAALSSSEREREDVP